MNSWLEALKAQTLPGILVTVAGVEGSGPREPGAKMFITADRLSDTIGGGHLELCAIDIARQMLGLPAGVPQAERRLQRFSLGPALGQCCGGVVYLVFERVDPGLADVARHVSRLHARLCQGQDSTRLVALDSMDRPGLFSESGASLDGAADTVLLNRAPCHIFADAKGRRWLQDTCVARRAQLMLFGAGHVGAAIARALADLPCSVTWVDERADQFPAGLPANVRLEVSDAPEALVDAAGPGVSFLVLTHSHALDQLLAEHILRRAEFFWFGLIGSKTKRALFERRLLARGITGSQLSRMVCPIGIAGIAGKSPPVIAIAVAAQLMQVWEAQHHR